MQLVSRKPVEAQPQRMGPLAKLPVFFDLKGRRAVVAGGSAAAAWKAELLAAAGAHVEIYAAELGDEMAELLFRGAAPGDFVHHPRPWSLDVFGHAAIALADAETDAEAQAFCCAARSAGVPVNVIDKPAFCQFQFGAIVNRSPVVIGISTDGAAPILGQAIRRRIETLLPTSLAAWAALAQTVRERVMQRLEKGPARRRFWEQYADCAFGPAPTAQDRAALDNLIDTTQSATSQTGRVTLVGAGPGDAELLTLKAVRALQAADVILFDDLVSDEVLELARREAKRMMVGKRGQRESCAQGDINALMVQLAKQGKRVVRLKSGDPMIFGRAGEEIAELVAQGITVDVVPGITAALAVASSLGVSLTHRDHAQSVRFVTGHTRDGELSDGLDWNGLADPATTLVLYMGGRTSPAIATRLMARGLASSTPVVVVSGATRPEETRWFGDLAGLAGGSGLPAQGLPVLIGIGRAFAAARSCAMEGTIGNSALSAHPATSKRDRRTA
jgi:uroporphyrin-III C-methyltransferase / precorrin-2 dehydrogenase / sirohydrochlorin ferrochelatase